MKRNKLIASILAVTLLASPVFASANAKEKPETGLVSHWVNKVSKFVTDHPVATVAGATITFLAGCAAFAMHKRAYRQQIRQRPDVAGAHAMMAHVGGGHRPGDGHNIEGNNPSLESLDVAPRQATTSPIWVQKATKVMNEIHQTATREGSRRVKSSQQLDEEYASQTQKQKAYTQKHAVTQATKVILSSMITGQTTYHERQMNLFGVSIFNHVSLPPYFLSQITAGTEENLLHNCGLLSLSLFIGLLENIEEFRVGQIRLYQVRFGGDGGSGHEILIASPSRNIQVEIGIDLWYLPSDLVVFNILRNTLLEGEAALGYIRSLARQANHAIVQQNYLSESSNAGTLRAHQFYQQLGNAWREDLRPGNRDFRNLWKVIARQLNELDRKMKAEERTSIQRAGIDFRALLKEANKRS